jgi:hypothetical protein
MQEFRRTDPHPGFSTEQRPAGTEGLRDALRQFGASLHETFSELLRLVALECRVSALALSGMLALAVFGGLLLMTLWSLVLAMAAFGLHAAGLPWLAVIAILLGLSLAAGIYVLFTIRRLGGRIGLDATLQVLGP